jgi:hypothetical protein
MASKEQDPEQLFELIRKINSLLEEREKNAKKQAEAS